VLVDFLVLPLTKGELEGVNYHTKICLGDKNLAKFTIPPLTPPYKGGENLKKFTRSLIIAYIRHS